MKNFCDDWCLSAQKKEVTIVVAGNQWLTWSGGASLWTGDSSWPLTPAKGFFHITLCCGELGSVVGHFIVDKSLNYEEDRLVFE